ncbi:MAG TPA: recombination mediator RecR [Phycisphaeraceae bacterium]
MTLRPSTIPNAFENLVQQLSRLPGLGRRSAQRIAFHLLKSPPEEAAQLAQAIRDFKTNLKVCSICGHVSESDPCPICTDPQRDHGQILVVEQPSDVASLEQTGLYKGVYHVLMGRLAPLEGVGPGDLNIDRLLQRVASGGVREVILGTNPTLEGDGTALYLAQQLGQRGVKVSRLARGLPTGSSLGTVSKAVLVDALQGRQDLAF